MRTDSDQFSQQWISHVLDGGPPADAGPSLPDPATWRSRSCWPGACAP